MTSGPNLTEQRFRRIDDSNRADHHHLKDTDRCYFLYEYTSGTDYSFSETNSLINNLKKELSKRDTNLLEFRHKKLAIKFCADALAQAFPEDSLKKCTLVPIPPSKAKNHTEYDDRMLQVCKRIPVPFSIDVRELVTQKDTTPAAHKSLSDRPSIDQIANNYIVDENELNPKPSIVGVVDDVLTTGAHFKAMQQVLQPYFPNVPLVGIFIARRVFRENHIC